MTAETIGERIAKLRGSMSQTELANRVKAITGESLSRAAIAQWEGGTVKNLRPENLLAVCEVFDVDPWSLVFGKFPKKAHEASEPESAMTDAIHVSDHEREILVLYRTLPDETKDVVRGLVKQIADAVSDSNPATKAAIGIADQAPAHRVEEFGTKPRSVQPKRKVRT